MLPVVEETLDEHLVSEFKPKEVDDASLVLPAEEKPEPSVARDPREIEK